jgi:hypothetical protein
MEQNNVDIDIDKTRNLIPNSEKSRLKNSVQQGVPLHKKRQRKMFLIHVVKAHGAGSKNHNGVGTGFLI